jgi:CubicO group peptidase (beta-lactamase class C family)
MGAIVLSKIIDYILIPYSSFYEYSKNLFAKWKLTNTYWWIDIPESKLSNIQCYDNEFKFYNNQYVTLSTPLGTVHDPKARIIGVCGHAGIFSCADDIRILSQKLLSGEIFDRNIVNIITHQTYDSVCATNHFGLLCYKKYENARQSEIPYTSSDSSIAISGYTGTYWLLDFELNNFLFIGTNRLYNRLSNLTEIPILNESIDAPIRGTKDYVYRKDVLRDLIINVKPSAYP